MSAEEVNEEEGVFKQGDDAPGFFVVEAPSFLCLNSVSQLLVTDERRISSAFSDMPPLSIGALGCHPKKVELPFHSSTPSRKKSKND